MSHPDRHVRFGFALRAGLIVALSALAAWWSWPFSPDPDRTDEDFPASSKGGAGSALRAPSPSLDVAVNPLGGETAGTNDSSSSPPAATAPGPIRSGAAAPVLVGSTKAGTASATATVIGPGENFGTDPESDACLQAALALAEKSPGDALRWAIAQPREHAGAAIIAAAYEAARSQPLEALGALADLPGSLERDAALTHTASQWALREPQAAVTWAGQFPSGMLHDQVASAVAIALADHEPWTAADFAATQIADAVQLRTTAVSVAQRWAQQAPAAARAWAAKFPAGSLREDLIREIRVQESASRRQAMR